MISEKTREKHLKQLPELLYKYCSYDDNLKSTLNERYFYYSKPKDFNDPFDCNIKLLKPPSIEIAKQFLLQGNEDLSRKDRRDIEKKCKNKSQTVIQSVVKGFESQLEEYGVCCFSKEKNHPLMWAHYTDKHQGIMLTLKPKNDLEHLTVVKVDYQKDYIAVDYTDNLSESLLKFISVKSNSWSYENEYRGFRTKFGKHSFNPKALESITLGVKFDKTKISELREIVDKHYPHVDIYETVFAKDKIELIQNKI